MLDQKVEPHASRVTATRQQRDQAVGSPRRGEHEQRERDRRHDHAAACALEDRRQRHLEGDHQQDEHERRHVEELLDKETRGCRRLREPSRLTEEVDARHIAGPGRHTNVEQLANEENAPRAGEGDPLGRRPIEVPPAPGPQGGADHHACRRHRHQADSLPWRTRRSPGTTTPPVRPATGRPRPATR